jgi:hypothetical protein
MSSSPGKCLGILVLFTVVLPVIPLVAQVPPASLQQAEIRDNQVGIPLSPDANWRDRVRFMNESSSHFFNRRPSNPGSGAFFFPPIPPPLGSEIPILGPIAAGPSAPPEMMPFVGELFYPFLASRIVTDSLGGGLRARLEAYRTSKIALQGELRGQVAAANAAEPKAREQQLESFAVSQAPRIAELEATAEKLRKDLQWNGAIGILEATGEPTDAPARPAQAAGGVDHSPVDPNLEAWELRTTAFYQDGLSAAQRRLLLESAIELRAVPNESQAADPTQMRGRLLPFSPEPARIRIPSDLPEPLASMIAEYILAKSRLKSEVLDELAKTRDSGSNARVQVLTQFAGEQAPRIAALDEKAEEIRRELATLPNASAPPAPPALPSYIAERISAYRKHKLEVLRVLHDMLAGNAPAPSTASANVADPNSNAFAWLRDGKTRTEVQVSYLPGSVEEFDSKQEELITGLNKELAAIRKELSEYMQSRNATMGGKSIDGLLGDFEDARQKQELWDKYRDYRDAVLMPGLSPAQRRLLMDAAAVQLMLPLPPGQSGP